MSARDPGRRIPKALSDDRRLFGSYTLRDLVVVALPAVGVVLATHILPASMTVQGVSVHMLTVPLAAVAAAFGAVFVYLAPAHTDSVTWVRNFIAYQRSDTQLAHEEAKQYTQVERVYPEYDAIERTDGTIVGAVQVTPATMALATREEWADKADDFQNFVNTTVEFPIQIYSTTQSFPVDEYIAHFEQRRGDPDVKANPQLRELLDAYVDWYRGELQERQMAIREHYVIVPVKPQEVQFAPESLKRKLVTVPYLGVGIYLGLRVLARLRGRHPGVVERAAQLEALDTRCDSITGGLRDINGCDARRVPTDGLTRVVGEFWAGTDLEYGDMNRVLRRAPIVQGDYSTR